MLLESGVDNNDMNAAQEAVLRDARDDATARLEARVGAYHTALRLGIEQDHQARVFGQGRNFFHIENWYGLHGLIRLALRLSLLHGRGQRNARDIRVEYHRVGIRKLPDALRGFTLLHLSDLHLDCAPDFAHHLIETVRPLDYDACVMTGDYRARTYGDCDAALTALRQLRLHLRDPVFAVLGNHDSLRMLPAMEDMGIRVLVNETATLERGGAQLHLCGIDDPHYFRADNLEKALDGVPREAPSVLLSHSPEVYRHAAHAGIDLMLAGHTHGGQICLPGGIPVLCNAACPRALCRGPWHYNGMRGYTSRGSGASVVDVRLNCPPEVTLHRLEPL